MDLRPLIRQRQKLGKRLPRAPRQPYPFAIEREYERDLRGVAETLKQLTENMLLPALPSLARQASFGKPGARLDAWDDEVGAIISDMGVAWERRWTKDELARMARKKGDSVSQVQKRAMERQFKRVLGIDIWLAEPWLQGQLAAFNRQNVELISSVKERYYAEIQSLTMGGFRAGTRWELLADEIEKRYGVAKSRAELIARDQISKITGQLTMLRQQELGVQKYTWSTSLDERVRDSHRSKEGKVFRWDSPPSDTGHPGEDFQCRCVAIPWFEDWERAA